MTNSIQKRAMMLLSIVIVIAILMPTLTLSSSLKTVIEDRRIDSIGIGDQAQKIVSTFGNRYLVVDEKKAMSAREIKLLDQGDTVVKFTIDDKGHILLIDVYASYGTKEGIGVGSTLSDAQRAYGEGRIGPTDAGYWVTFDKLKGVSFLLNDSDIPKGLRRIPDDVITKAQEREILAIGRARIIAIEIF
jgi:hypothetical protein